ncbi:MAG: M28 family peptidase [Bacteroidetes bacterium]|nr:M28 family peptidase [Bacteroidota bacterium]
MKKFLVFICFWCFSFLAKAQLIDQTINESEVSRIEKTLSSDDMKGRAVFTEGIDKAAAFISQEFQQTGLQRLPGLDSYLQPFILLKPEQLNAVLVLDNKKIDSKNLVVITTKKEFSITEKSGFEQEQVKSMDGFFKNASNAIKEGKKKIFWIDTSFASSFSRFSFFKRSLNQNAGDVVFVLSSIIPKSFTIEATHRFEEKKLANVVGILKGKTKPNEYVIFSAHYDHLGIGKAVNGDSIFNGANDDASGTTAVILLAKYFKALQNNNRTIIFVTFTGEESGGLGSGYFSNHIPPAQVMAMFNIEMIGTDSKWGLNAAYITGYEKTNMGEILQKNLSGTGFNFYPDPYTEENLFYRSDNATLARLGVPAHTISTSKMDNEPNYHKVSDEISTLNLKNMAAIIRAIAISSTSIIQGIDTPSRVKIEELK